jgi:hypothetical protein
MDKTNRNGFLIGICAVAVMIIVVMHTAYIWIYQRGYIDGADAEQAMPNPETLFEAQGWANASRALALYQNHTQLGNATILSQAIGGALLNDCSVQQQLNYSYHPPRSSVTCWVNSTANPPMELRCQLWPAIGFNSIDLDGTCNITESGTSYRVDFTRTG